MANTGDEYGLFWNSQSGDREYNSDSLEIWLKKFFFSGVFNGDLAVTATTGMGISVGSGYANVEGKVMFFGAPTTFTLAAADPGNDRIDTVVVERNDGNREITLKLVQGIPSATPIPVAPVRGNGVYQLVLAQILVGSAVSSISQLDITDTRSNSALCGWVASTVSEIDFDSMMAQYTAWFDEFTSHFDTDVALELQQEIDEINSAMGTFVQTRTLSASGWSNGVYNLASIYPNNEYDIQVTPCTLTTSAQLKAWSLARPIGSASANTITALGTTPTIDITVMVVATKKGAS